MGKTLGSGCPVEVASSSKKRLSLALKLNMSSSSDDADEPTAAAEEGTGRFPAMVNKREIEREMG